MRTLGERGIQDRTATWRREELILPRTGYDQGKWKERKLLLKGKRLMNTGLQMPDETRETYTQRKENWKIPKQKMKEFQRMGQSTDRRHTERMALLEAKDLREQDG